MVLSSGLFKPFRKIGDRPSYINASSNHPPQVIKNLPAGIELRLSSNSANRAIFEQAVPMYQSELLRCGFDYKLEYREKEEGGSKKCGRSSKRRITWYNPPYCMNVCSNVARDFLALIDKHFKAGNPLKNIMNRSCIKVSYRCLPNIGARIAGHNKKILRKAEEKKAEGVKTGVKPCNCQKSKVAECPTPGACNTDGVIYKATVSSSDGRKEYYVGLAKNFKLRFAGHKIQD